MKGDKDIRLVKRITIKEGSKEQFVVQKSIIGNKRGAHLYGDHNAVEEKGYKKSDFYFVEISQTPSCSCADFEKHNSPNGSKKDDLKEYMLCKHILFIYFRIFNIKEDDKACMQTFLKRDEVKRILKNFDPTKIKDEYLACNERVEAYETEFHENYNQDNYSNGYSVGNFIP